MFECEICGLLSLGGSACPACGSLLLVDLSLEDGDSSPLPNEVPGLDDAVASWYELEGIEPPTESAMEPVASTDSGSLPFGYSGESNTHLSRLPFGVGSYANGMPFDETEEALPLISGRSNPPATQPTPLVEVAPAPVLPTPAPAPAPAPAIIHENVVTAAPMQEVAIFDATPQMVGLPEMMIPAQPSIATVEPEPFRVDAIAISHTNASEATSTPSLVDEVPEMWRINASPVDMDQIYAMEDQIVEVVHSTDESQDTYLHTTDVEDVPPDSGVISLDLHPARAMGVGLEGLPELEDTLAEGFYAIGQESWAQAAISFQKMAAKMPGDSAVFNNYGLALLQRALVMAKSTDLEVQQLASTQFESSILALREAAKTSPTNPTILLNLSHALLVSGRAEKSLLLLNMYEKNHSKTAESANLEAASLVSLGESGRALKVLQLVTQDETIRSNVEKLTYS